MSRPRKYGKCPIYGNHKPNGRGRCACGFMPRLGKTVSNGKNYRPRVAESIRRRQSGLWCWDCLSEPLGQAGGTEKRCPGCTEKHRTRERLRAKRKTAVKLSQAANDAEFMRDVFSRVDAAVIEYNSRVIQGARVSRSTIIGQIVGIDPQAIVEHGLDRLQPLGVWKLKVKQLQAQIPQAKGTGIFL